jgi:hypothetical protein
LIVDSIDGIKIIATGSSVLIYRISWRTISRKNTIYLFPLAQMEFAKYENLKKPLKIRRTIAFGSYP